MCIRDSIKGDKIVRLPSCDNHLAPSCLTELSKYIEENGKELSAQGLAKLLGGANEWGSITSVSSFPRSERVYIDNNGNREVSNG